MTEYRRTSAWFGASVEELTECLAVAIEKYWSGSGEAPQKEAYTEMVYVAAALRRLQAYPGGYPGVLPEEHMQEAAANFEAAKAALAALPCVLHEEDIQAAIAALEKEFEIFCAWDEGVERELDQARYEELIEGLAAAIEKYRSGSGEAPQKEAYTEMVYVVANLRRLQAYSRGYPPGVLPEEHMQEAAANFEAAKADLAALPCVLHEEDIQAAIAALEKELDRELNQAWPDEDG